MLRIGFLSCEGRDHTRFEGVTCWQRIGGGRALQQPTPHAAGPSREVDHAPAASCCMDEATFDERILLARQPHTEPVDTLAFAVRAQRSLVGERSRPLSPVAAQEPPSPRQLHRSPPAAEAFAGARR